jgi:hypothetical protein
MLKMAREPRAGGYSPERDRGRVLPSDSGLWPQSSGSSPVAIRMTLTAAPITSASEVSQLCITAAPTSSPQNVDFQEPKLDAETDSASDLAKNLRELKVGCQARTKPAINKELTFSSITVTWPSWTMWHCPSIV